ncbi:MAG TPA: hypothetical protein VF077_00555 [Nitrospiraceae bacterium]
MFHSDIDRSHPLVVDKATETSFTVSHGGRSVITDNQGSVMDVLIFSGLLAECGPDLWQAVYDYIRATPEGTLIELWLDAPERVFCHRISPVSRLEAPAN